MCVMAEPRALYGMCSKEDTYAAHEMCTDLSMMMYLRSSLAAVDSPWMVNVFSFIRPAKLRSSQGMYSASQGMYSAGHVGARETSALIDAGRTPERRVGPSTGRPGMARGFLPDDSRTKFGVGDSYHVVRSERGVFAVWDGLARNEVRRLPAQAGGPREGSGPKRPIQLFSFCFWV